MTRAELLDTLFDAEAHPLAADAHRLAATMEAWLADSRRFAGFVEAFHTKIRKKVRSARDSESVLDLELELHTAYLLLRQKAIRLVYEPGPGVGARGPDFSVTVDGSGAVMLEVTRLRHATPAETGRRVTAAICAKLGQLQRGGPNLVLVAVDGPGPSAADLREAMLGLQQRAEGGGESLFERYGFRDRRAFFEHQRRLSAVVVRPFGTGDTPPTVWPNPQASHPLRTSVRTVLLRGLGA